MAPSTAVVEFLAHFRRAQEGVGKPPNGLQAVHAVPGDRGGPVSTTIDSATAEDVRLGLGVLGAQIHEGHADARQCQQEVDAALTAQTPGLT